MFVVPAAAEERPPSWLDLPDDGFDSPLFDVLAPDPVYRQMKLDLYMRVQEEYLRRRNSDGAGGGAGGAPTGNANLPQNPQASKAEHYLGLLFLVTVYSLLQCMAPFELGAITLFHFLLLWNLFFFQATMWVFSLLYCFVSVLSKCPCNKRPLPPPKLIFWNPQVVLIAVPQAFVVASVPYENGALLLLSLVVTNSFAVWYYELSPQQQQEQDDPSARGVGGVAAAKVGIGFGDAGLPVADEEQGRRRLG